MGASLTLRCLDRIKIMSRLRVLFAWLLLAAIPLQGLAAASMLFCGMGPLHGAKVQAQAVAVAVASHDHAAHGHADAAKADQGTQLQSQSQLPDSSHKCGVCASCCHGVAITGTQLLVAIAPLPPADAAEPFVLIHPRPSTVPDKPPRA